MFSRAVYALTPLFGRLTVTSEIKLRPPAGTIFVANHDSMADPAVVLTALRRFELEPVVMATAGLWRIPLLGRALTREGHIPVHRRSARAALALDAAAEALAGAGMCCSTARRTAAPQGRGGVGARGLPHGTRQTGPGDRLAGRAGGARGRPTDRLGLGRHSWWACSPRPALSSALLLTSTWRTAAPALGDGARHDGGPARRHHGMADRGPRLWRTPRSPSAPRLHPASPAPRASVRGPVGPGRRGAPAPDPRGPRLHTRPGTPRPPRTSTRAEPRATGAPATSGPQPASHAARRRHPEPRRRTDRPPRTPPAGRRAASPRRAAGPCCRAGPAAWARAWCRLGPSGRIWRSTACTHSRPTSAKSWCTVVSGGRKEPASGMSSKPTTLTSSGTRRPRSCRARSSRAPSGRWPRRRRCILAGRRVRSPAR